MTSSSLFSLQGVKENCWPPLGFFMQLRGLESRCCCCANVAALLTHLFPHLISQGGRERHWPPLGSCKQLRDLESRCCSSATANRAPAPPRSAPHLGESDFCGAFLFLLIPGIALLLLHNSKLSTSTSTLSSLSGYVGRLQYIHTCLVPACMYAHRNACT